MHGRINIGIIGTGRIGRLHAENLTRRIPEARVVAVADSFTEAAETCAHDFGIPAAHGDPGKIMTDPDVDAILICSSTDTHARMIVEAAEAGKHIFCEKPIDFDLQKIDRALKAVNKAGVKLQVGFNRRFDPNFRHASEMVSTGKVGTPHLLRISSRDPEPPPLDYVKVSGGIFLDMTIHDFDMARYLLKDEVVEVFAAGEVLVDPEIGKAGDVDTCVITLRFSGGALGTIDNSRQAVYGYDQRVEVFGSGGMVAVSNNTPDTVVHSDEKGVHASLPLFFFVERYTESYLAEMRAFLEALLLDKPPLVTGEDGRVPVVMGMAAMKSIKEKRPVKLSEID